MPAAMNTATLHLRLLLPSVRVTLNPDSRAFLIKLLGAAWQSQSHMDTKVLFPFLLCS